MADELIPRLTFQTVTEGQADGSLAQYEPFAGDQWNALLAPGVEADSLTDAERGLVVEAALGAQREGRVLVVELAGPASS